MNHESFGGVLLRAESNAIVYLGSIANAQRPLLINTSIRLSELWVNNHSLKPRLPSLMQSTTRQHYANESS